MKLIELDTGYINAPIIDLDRIMYIQWYDVKKSDPGIPNGGRIVLYFFGRDEITDIQFKTKDDAIRTFNQIKYLTDTKRLDDVVREKTKASESL